MRKHRHQQLSFNVIRTGYVILWLRNPLCSDKELNTDRYVTGPGLFESKPRLCIFTKLI